jgi:probable rRNA maturation factor
MLLELAEAYSDTLTLDANAQVVCDFSLSESVLKAHTEESVRLYALITEKLPALWRNLALHLPENRWIAQMTASEETTLNYSVILVTDEEIRNLNRDFRGKDSATDVLTFSLLEDGKQDQQAVPELYLGEVFLSLSWAMTEICKQIEAEDPPKLNFSHGLSLFILERLVHGTLHLLGVHHNTMSDYNKVVETQRLVVHAITQEASTPDKP